MDRKQNAFTLIELLVVIAIIALLLSVIVPSLKKAKESAMDVICQNQIKQYHVGAAGYALSNKNEIPNCEDWLYLKFTPVEKYKRDPSSLYNFDCVWHNKMLDPDGLIMDYLSNQKVQLCPVFDKYARRSGCNPQQPSLHNPAIPIEPVFNYSQNCFLGRMRTMSAPDNITQLNRVKSPSQVVLYAEENPFIIPANIRPGMTTSSRTTINDCLLYSLAVGIVGAKADLAANGGKFNYKGQRCDTFASYHKAKDAAGYLGFSYAVFVDGHLGKVTPEETVQLTWPY